MNSADILKLRLKSYNQIQTLHINGRMSIYMQRIAEQNDDLWYRSNTDSSVLILTTM